MVRSELLTEIFAFADEEEDLDEADEDDGPEVVVNDIINTPARARKVFNRHPKTKTAAIAAMGITSLGVSGTQFLTGGGAIAVATGAAAGAGPVGLVIAGAALAGGSQGLAVRSMIKTHRHILGLNDIRLGAAEIRCPSADTPEHEQIETKILDYIIKKKKKKMRKKAISSAPLGGLLVLQHRAGKGLAKWALGRKGKNRNLYAQIIAQHHWWTSGECGLTTAILAELFGMSEELAVAAGEIDPNDTAPAIARKMKSV